MAIRPDDIESIITNKWRAYLKMFILFSNIGNRYISFAIVKLSDILCYKWVIMEYSITPISLKTVIPNLYFLVLFTGKT